MEKELSHTLAELSELQERNVKLTEQLAHATSYSNELHGQNNELQKRVDSLTQESERLCSYATTFACADVVESCCFVNLSLT